MQRLEVSGAVQPIYGSLGVKRLSEAAVASRSGTRVPYLSLYLQQELFVTHCGMSSSD